MSHKVDDSSEYGDAEDTATTAPPTKKTTTAIQPEPRARGVFDGPSDLAKDTDHYLAQTGFGRRRGPGSYQR
jgi:hypothetical protein